MATFILQAVGTAIGGPIGGIIGAALGSVIDRAAISALTPGPKTQYKQGQQLKEIQLTTSSEGSPVYRLYGRARIGGQCIWTTQFKEVVNTTVTKTKTGGKSAGVGKSAKTVSTEYTYFLSFAIAFCEGDGKALLGRVYVDGKEIDISKYTFRFYPGSPTQSPDPKIQAVEGAANAPAYRGMVYIVFEDLPLADFGNRMPQITAEIVNPLYTADPDDISNCAKAFTLIPASGESVYGTQQYNINASATATKPDNIHNNFRLPDAVVSLDQLNRNQNDLQAVSIVVSWFGTDLRAGECRVIPKHEGGTRVMSPTDWAVAGYNRLNAQVVSYDDQNRPIFGGTPSDTTVTEMIQHVRSTMGKRAIFYPFIMMDIPSGNTLPNPYSNGAASTGQAVFPWRGRITCSPAIGFSGSPDKSASAATQINTFFTRTEGYRAMILHYANLCVAAGGVDAFIIGSELVGLTTVRQANGVGPYPAVTQLAQLAVDVKAIFTAAGQGSTKVGYAADWSEYHSHRPSDGTNDVIFNMDPLWASSGIDFVGIDNYLPMSDWRDGGGHLDYDPVNGPTVLHDPDYLASNIEGGEYFDWFYENQTNRDNQVRTPITDAAYGKPWVFRQKDIRSWWSNTHKNRPGGTESGSTTSWMAQSKPVWFTEFGCPAVDKGSNQPNVFYDPKSSESFFSYYSTGQRDDFIHRIFSEVTLAYWRDNAPTSMVYGDKMVKPANMFIWTWDARPFPDYPARSNIWSDGTLWFYGHWFTGRIDAVPLPRLVADLCLAAGLQTWQIDTSGLYGPGALVRGYLLDGIMSPRDALNTLANAYQFDAYESGGKVRFILRSAVKTLTIDPAKHVITDDDPVGVTITRGQETDLPTAVKITFVDEFNDYQTASVDGKKGTGSSQNVTTQQFPVVLNQDYVRSLADSIIHQSWVARETGEVTLPHSMARLDAGDAFLLQLETRTIGVRAKQVDIGESRKVEFEGFDTSLFALPAYPVENRVPLIADIYGQAVLEFVDVPLFTGQEDLPHAPRLAAYADPWPGQLAIYTQQPDTVYELTQILEQQVAMGELVTPLYSGPLYRWDRGNTFQVRFYNGAISSVTEAVMFRSALGLGIRNADGGWEVLQFSTATLTGPKTYLVSNLIRGQLGTEKEMRNPVAAGARVVLLEPGVLVPLNVSKDLVTIPQVYRWGPLRYPLTDYAYVEATRSGGKVGLRPYSPTDLNLHKYVASGNLVLTWKRRTRYNGDDWEVTDVPLNEEFERYRVIILASPGGAVKRTVEVDVSYYTYTAAEQTADFGAAQTTLHVSVAQYGSFYGGYGTSTEESVDIGSSS